MAALRATSEAGAAVMLLSPPAGALSLGAAVFAAMIEDAHAHFPGVDVIAVLDCADQPGAAMNALRHGIKAIRLEGPPDVLSKIKDMAAQLDSNVEDGDVPTLDLLHTDDPLTACRKWLNPQ